MLGFSISLNNVSPIWGACQVLPIFHLHIFHLPETLRPITSSISKSWDCQVHHIPPILVTINLKQAINLCWWDNCLGSFSHLSLLYSNVSPQFSDRDFFSLCVVSIRPLSGLALSDCVHLSSLVTNHPNLFHRNSTSFVPVPNCSVLFLSIEMCSSSYQLLA